MAVEFSALIVKPFEDIRRHTQDIYNRLHSIDEDARFVDSVRAEYNSFPVIPNLRCGAWYVNPGSFKEVPVYFKSTDGHHGQWAFNLRRANLHLLPVIVEHGGVFLVDSTRRGKRIPDALAKTVPLWCAVLNRAISLRFHDASWPVMLWALPSAVASSEHAQMEALVEGYAQKLLAAEYTLPKLAKPLRPFWVTPATTVLPARGADLEFYPVICLSASKLVPDGLDRRAAGHCYVQGAGDDHESWSLGLSPALYWTHREELLAATQDELPEVVQRIAAASSASITDPSPDVDDITIVSIPQVGGRIALAVMVTQMSDQMQRQMPETEARIVLQTSENQDESCEEPSTENTESTPRLLTFQVTQGKRGQHHFLHQILPHAVSFAQQHLRSAEAPRLVIASDVESSKDVAIGVAVAILAACFNNHGAILTADSTKLDKETIRRRLQWILEAKPGVNPSRTTLKRVNEFLMSNRTDSRNSTA